MCFRKPELIPTLFIVAAVSTLLGLGIWQLQRLQWKNSQIASIERAHSMPLLGTLPHEPDGLEYRNVMFVGTFLHDKNLHMIGAPQGAEIGFFMVTPFRLEDDGRIILINRGFSPEGKESRPQGTQTISGIIRPPRPKRMFSPANHPEKNVWFYEDIPAMSQATGVTLTSIIVEAVGKAEKGVYPVPSDGKISIRNDHLNYAITWFSLAIIALVMFGFYYRKPKS